MFHSPAWNNEQGTATFWGVPLVTFGAYSDTEVRYAIELTSGQFAPEQHERAKWGQGLEQDLIAKALMANLERTRLAGVNKQKLANSAYARKLAGTMLGSPSQTGRKPPPPNMAWLDGEIRRVRERSFV